MKKKPVIALLANFPLHLADASYKQHGWHSATWLAAMYEMLRDSDKYEIHWLTFRQRTKKRTFESNGQFFHVLPAYSLKYAQKTGYLHARWLVARELSRIKPDILHVWGTEGRYAVSGMGYKGKKLLTIQGNLTGYAQRAPMPDFMIRQAAWERKAVKKYTLFTGESPWSVERIKEIVPGSNPICWDYCVEAGFFATERHQADAPCCLLAGSDSAIKNIQTAIDAFSAPELAGIQLFMAGPEAKNHPNLPPNIHALGGVSRDEMVRLMSETWCLVHPSLAETGPTVAKEARVMGVPVIISDECGSQQYVDNGQSGFIIKPKDTEALIRSVLAVTKDRETAEAMGRHRQEFCRQALSKEHMMEGLCRLYDDLLSTP